MGYKVMKKIADVPWEGHFMDAGNSRIKWVYTAEKDGTPMTVMIIELEKGISLPDHRHADQPDLIYPLSGKATMFIEGQGEFPLEPGMVVVVPPNTLHAIRNIEETVTLYNVFAPAMQYKPALKK
jgi:quercetin dioxygenase-like cupin family protein